MLEALRQLMSGVGDTSSAPDKGDGGRLDVTLVLEKKKAREDDDEDDDEGR